MKKIFMKKQIKIIVSLGIIFSCLSMDLPKDTIINANRLNHFFEELHALQTKKDTIINIVHLGDSHIQAGHLPGKIRRLLQEKYGNAGRGWIAPFKISRTNEPDDYFITTNNKEWTTGRCIQNIKKTPIGLGGIGILTQKSPVDFNIKIAPVNGAGYSFNKIISYRGEKAQPLAPKNQIPVYNSIDQTPIVSGLKTDTFEFSKLVDECLLKTFESGASNENLYFGFNLSNGQSGILYHSIGVNGAMFVNYTNENYIQQLTTLNPSLLIISLGTNETFGRNFRSEEFEAQVERLVKLIKKYMPDTNIILTTPPEVYKRIRVNNKRTYTRNKNTEFAAKAICKVATIEKVACWDLFTISGGKGSNTMWHKKGYLNTDRIHFTREGYRYQGEMFYNSLMSAYNQYLNKK